MNSTDGTRTPSGDRPASADPIADFRVRSAQARRAVTSVRICAAALELIGEHGATTLTVEAVNGRSGLSRGAFYRYFASVEALLDHLADAVGAQLNAEMSERFDTTADPAERIAMCLRYQVTRVLSDGACAAVLARFVALHGAVSRLADAHTVADFTEAARAGRFTIPAVRVTVDLAHGVLASVLRRAVTDGPDPERLAIETAFLLRACGVDAEDAALLSSRALPAAPAEALREQVLLLCSTA